MYTSANRREKDGKIATGTNNGSGQFDRRAFRAVIYDTMVICTSASASSHQLSVPFPIPDSQPTAIELF